MVNIEQLRERALKILSPIQEAEITITYWSNSSLKSERSSAGRLLPDYFLVYFLFSNLLKFRSLGRFEKVAWSFPIEYNGKVFYIEHRKLGFGIFVQDLENDKNDAETVVKKISGAVKAITPFFDMLAKEALSTSDLNVNNNSGNLFKRYKYLLELYKAEKELYEINEGKNDTDVEISDIQDVFTYYKSLSHGHRERSNWLAISAIEAFFSWTEHLFVHLAILVNHISDGNEVAELVLEEWNKKYKKAITFTSKEEQKFYNELILVRQQLRNFVTHGAFGKNGNAFSFHSQAGAVPLLMKHNRKKNRFGLQGHLSFDDKTVIQLLEDFEDFLWTSSLKPAMYYIQDFNLPSILTFSKDGRYAAAMNNMEDMRKFAEYLNEVFSNSLNMDW